MHKLRPSATMLLTLAGVAGTIILGAHAFAAPFPKLKVEPVDPLVKVFRDEKPPVAKSASADAARGEHASFQLVVNAPRVDVTDLRCELTPLTTTAGKTLPGASRVRLVGYIGSSESSKAPASDQLRPAPAMYPDPLIEGTTVTVSAGENQPIWITTHVALEAEPGDYHSTSVVSAKIFGVETSVSLPLSLKVYPAKIEKTRLHVTNWYQMWHHHDTKMPERFSPEYFEVLRGYIRNMVAHRQNWARIETLWILGYSRDASGQLQFDFTNFDKWMNILLEEGIQNIEGLQFAWRSGTWDEPFHVEIHDETTTDYKGRKVPADSREAEEFYSRFFPRLKSHLQEKGWLDKYVQHVGDEPVVKNADSYTTASQLLKKYAPGIPVMEACLTHSMVGAVDIWVPLLNELHKDFDFFQERKRAGDRVWMYTCLIPTGEYANRFLDLPLIKTRLLHWINYRYDIEGYLHWGYNFWRPYPWDNAADAKAKFPGGDAWIVYPQKGGLGVVDSIRWEAMRDGIEDHELLSQLGERDKEGAMALAQRHILNWNRYETDVETFRATRRELLERVSKLKGK